NPLRTLGLPHRRLSRRRMKIGNDDGVGAPVMGLELFLLPLGLCEYEMGAPDTVFHKRLLYAVVESPPGDARRRHGAIARNTPHHSRTRPAGVISCDTGVRTAYLLINDIGPQTSQRLVEAERVEKVTISANTGHARKADDLV